MDNQTNGKLAYSILEVAAALGISKCLAYSLCKKGVIPTVKMGERRLIVPRVALEKMLLQAQGQQNEAERGEDG